MTETVNRAAPRGRDAYRHWTRVPTRWADNDAYGHVNNTVYYQWFDTAVNAWLIAAGLLDIAGGDPIGLVVETGCRYFAPLAFPQTIEVGLVLERLGSSSVAYGLGVFAEGAAAPAAEGRFVHVYVGRDDRCPAPLPQRWREAIAALG